VLDSISVNKKVCINADHTVDTTNVCESLRESAA
jgi:hypothetical protein